MATTQVKEHVIDFLKFFPFVRRWSLPVLHVKRHTTRVPVDEECQVDAANESAINNMMDSVECAPVSPAGAKFSLSIRTHRIKDDVAERSVVLVHSQPRLDVEAQLQSVEVK